MRFLRYIKENGIKRTLVVLYQYKLQIFLCKFILIFLKNKKLKNIIMIESHNDFDCNGGAFYDYLITNNYNEKYKIVWLVKNQAPKSLPQNVSAFSLYKPSIRKAYYNCIAKFFLSDCNIIEKLRTDQVSIYLTHGAVSLKNVRGKIFVPESVNYILSPSQNNDKIKANQFSLEYPCSRLIHLGYPCQDVLYADGCEELQKVTSIKYRKKIIWMPTFRKGGGYNRNDSTIDLPLGIPLIENESLFIKLNDYLSANETLLIIKIHPMQDMSTVKVHDTNNIKILTGTNIKEFKIDNYRLLKSADALISDYSSVAYDYLLLNRPLAFVLTDINEYKVGLVVDNPTDYMPGHLIHTVDDLFSFIKDIVQNVDIYEKERIKLINWLYQYKDGNSCARLADFMGLEK